MLYSKPNEPKLYEVIAPIALVFALLWGGVRYANSRVEKKINPNNLETRVVQVVQQADNQISNSQLPKRKISSGEFSYLDVYDRAIEGYVELLNDKHKQNLDADLIRAMIVTESGSPAHRDSAFKKDPMQIANKGDYAFDVLANKKEHTYLIGNFDSFKEKDKSEIDYNLSIYGGVGWLFHKAAIYDERIVENGELKDYTVKEGDSLWKIAKANKTEVETIKKYSRLENPDLIKPGQKLKFRESEREVYIKDWRSWKDAVEKYNGGGDSNYLEKVYNVYKELKN